MRLVKLTKPKREKLQAIVHSDHDAEKVRRAEAILWLDAGDGPTVVANRLGVARRTIYYWVAAFVGRGRRPLTMRIASRRRPGRPSDKQHEIQCIAARVMKRSPFRYGYLHHVWTARLIRKHVAEQHGVEASLKTVRRALQSLAMRYKRPRYILARRSPTWRQAKGGSNADFSVENA